MNKKKLLSKIFIASLALTLPLTGLGMIKSDNNVQAGVSSLGNYSESVSLTNSSFNGISSTYSKNDVSGWTRIRANGSATTMIMDTEKNYSTNKNGVYYLSCDNPQDASSNKEDHKILMINSALKSEQKDGYAREGYKSSEITLEANSHYYFQIAMKTESFNEATEFGSIYLSGLKDKDGNKVEASFEKQTAKSWTNYYFFVATGNETQKVTIDLWLGTQDMNSYGVAFFDEVFISKYSENLFFDKYYEDHASLSATTKLVNLKTSSAIDTSSLNFDFEKDYSSEADKLVDWTIDSSITTSTKAHAEVMNINSAEGFEAKTGKAYPGNNFRYNNNQSVVLWTDEAATVAIKSNEIDIKAQAYYKISMLVKTGLESGSFYVRLNETEKLFSQTMFVNNSALKDSYSLHSAESTGISSTAGNKFNNEYEEVSFYIQGSTYYDSAVTLSLSLGNSSSKALGFAVIDDIKIEHVSSSDYESASNKLSLAVSASTQTLANGFFNFTEASDNTLTYPLAPKDFDLAQEDEKNMAAGVINTFEDYYNLYEASYDWGKLSNPAYVQGAPASSKDSNNVFMFWNRFEGYQSLATKQTMSLSSQSYFEVSFEFKTYGSNLTLELVNDENVVLFKDSNITAEGAWQTYKANIFTGEAGHSIKAILHFGTENQKVKGYSFIDNLKLETSEENVFASAENQIDLSNLLLNLDPTGQVNSNITNHPAFKGTITAGNNAEGGVAIGNGNTSLTDQYNNPIDKNQDLPNNVLVMRVGDNSSYKLNSTYKLDVEEGKFYSLSFKLLTNHFADVKELPTEDENGKAITYDYGVTVGLTNFDKPAKFTSNEGWQNYTILFKATATESVNLEFIAVSDREGIYGTAFITDLVWQESDETAYSGAELKDSYNKTLFTTQTSSAIEETPEEDSDSDSSTDSSTSGQSDIAWLLIPSIITAVAIVIAIVGALLRKVKKGNKPVKKSKESYDRKETLDKNVIKNEALKIRDKEAADLEKQIESLKSDLANLDQAHKEFINESREKNNGKITKDIERQFKAYSSKRSKLTEKLQASNEHLKTVNSPEYLMTLEKKVSNEAAKLNKSQK